MWYSYSASAYIQMEESIYELDELRCKKYKRIQRYMCGGWFVLLRVFQCPQRTSYTSTTTNIFFSLLCSKYICIKTQKNMSILIKFDVLPGGGVNGENKHNAMIMLLLYIYAYTYVRWIFFHFDNNMRKLSLVGMVDEVYIGWFTIVFTTDIFFLLYHMLAIVSCEIVRAVWVGGILKLNAKSFRLVMLKKKTGGVIVLWHVVIFMIFIAIASSSPWDNFRVIDFEFDVSFSLTLKYCFCEL